LRHLRSERPLALEAPAPHAFTKLLEAGR
jgi:hypothetical protein